MSSSADNIALRSVPYDLCCTQLAYALGPKVLYPGKSSYIAVQQSYWSLQEASLSPSCILVPETAQDVSTAVSILAPLGEICLFAIKGQGHAPAAGFANINHGVTIDMTHLNSTAVSSNGSVFSVGGGATWLDAYVYLDKMGLAVAGGRNGAVGVGGLTLGGGISHFTARVGFACDNVVNYEIVLGSGKIVNANSTSAPDLFRALKGGGNNFGIVTRFDLATFPQGQIVSGSVVNDIGERHSVFKAFSDVVEARVFDPYASWVLGFVFESTSKAWTISSGLVYTKVDVQPAVFQELRAIPNLEDTFTITNYSVFANESATPPSNFLFYTGTYGMSVTLLSKMFDNLNSTISGFDIPEGIVWYVAFEPLPTAITKYGPLKGGNSLGTTPRDGNAFVILISVSWVDAASNTLVEQKANTVKEQLTAIGRRAGLLHSFQYMNYADPSQNPIASYGPNNVANLQKVSKKYDPNGVFQNQVPGGFKLGLY